MNEQIKGSDDHEVTCRLPRRYSTVPRARALLSAVLKDWRISQDHDVSETAELVLSELVTNALRVPVPRDRLIGVRITHSPEDGILRLEVSDAGAGRPEVRCPGEDETGGRGLLVVEALAHRWGVQDRAYGIGKTVWAELKAPDIIAVPAERKVAAVTVRAGQQVRWNGQWHTVRTVRCERSPSGGTVTLLGFDDAPTQRLDAAEPLTVRDGGQHDQCGASTQSAERRATCRDHADRG